MTYAKMTPVEQRVAVVAEWERSGLTMNEFCQRRGINPSTLGWWRRELRRRGDRKKAVELVEIRPAGTEAERAVEVVLANGIRLRVPVGFERRSLEEILAVVRAC
jgi:transposase-like protein